jgi:hypothetical protein
MTAAAPQQKDAPAPKPFLLEDGTPARQSQFTSQEFLAQAEIQDALNALKKGHHTELIDMQSVYGNIFSNGVATGT